jgi:hypothetical protein
MKRRNKRLRDDELAFMQTWQTVKESVRQLKHDYKRNNTWKTLRAAQTNLNTLSSSSAGSNAASFNPISCHNDGTGARGAENSS